MVDSNVLILLQCYLGPGKLAGIDRLTHRPSTIDFTV